jgi:hypothetical protein
VLLCILVIPSSSWAGGPGVWTKFATIDNPSDTVGMLRGANGTLRVVYLAKKAGNGTYSYATAEIALSGKLLATSTVLTGWNYLEPDPQLMSDGSGMRVVFDGSKGKSGCYFDGTIFTATSPTGSAWSLVQGSLSLHTAGVGNLAATTETNGTPVATFAGGHLFHVGVDPSCPAKSPDGTITPTPGSSQSNPAIVTDAHDGSVWVAWFQSFNKLNYWVERILPTQGSPIQAPNSTTTAARNNQPLEPVALATRVGGGVYMAYCSASSSQPCAHISLWRVGSAAAKVVPGSGNVTGARVALSPGSQGRLWVTWYDEAKNVIHAIRTNTSATTFGVLRTIKPPVHTSGVYAVQAQGSSGRLDVIVNDLLSTTPPIGLYHTQVLPGLSMHAQPHGFNHKHAATVTFTVMDAGQPVAAVKVSCLGRSAHTSATGHASLHFKKGAAVGRHVCAATKTGYSPGKTSIKVT